jgi:hypothetical protein
MVKDTFGVPRFRDLQQPERGAPLSFLTSRCGRKPALLLPLPVLRRLLSHGPKNPAEQVGGTPGVSHN